MSFTSAQRLVMMCIPAVTFSLVSLEYGKKYSCQNFDLFSHVFIREFYHLQISSTSYRHKLDSVGPAHQNQQQIRLNIHTCTIQRCYCKRDCLHRHLGIGIRLNLRIVKVKKKIYNDSALHNCLRYHQRNLMKTSRKSLGKQ